MRTYVICGILFMVVCSSYALPVETPPHEDIFSLFNTNEADKAKDISDGNITQTHQEDNQNIKHQLLDGISVVNDEITTEAAPVEANTDSSIGLFAGHEDRKEKDDEKDTEENDKKENVEDKNNTEDENKGDKKEEKEIKDLNGGENNEEIKNKSENEDDKDLKDKKEKVNNEDNKN